MTNFFSRFRKTNFGTLPRMKRSANDMIFKQKKLIIVIREDIFRNNRDFVLFIVFMISLNRSYNIACTTWDYY